MKNSKLLVFLRALRAFAVQPVGLALTAAVVALAGCQQPKPIVPGTLLPGARRAGAPLPGYRAVVKRYNARLAGLDQLWARTSVKARWRDQDGKARSEDGSGKLIVVPPRRVALTVGKLGHTGLWAGSNDRRYWLFDLRGHDTVYFGDHDRVGAPCARPLPLPIPPAAVPNLLGLTPLDPDRVPPPPAVERVHGYWLIQPPGTHARFLLDPQTARPVRIDLIGPGGQSVVAARLSDYRKVQAPGGPAPIIASHAEVFPLHQVARLTLDLSAMSEGRSRHRINPKVFDFQTLMRLHDPAKVIDLDAPCR